MRHQPFRWPSNPTSCRRVGAAHRGFGCRQCRVRSGTDSPDPSAIVPAAEVDRAARRLRHELGMLDQLAVHVDDVERPVRTGRQVDRPECRIGRGQELPSLLDSPGDERHAGRFEHAAVHQVCQRLAHERVAVVDAPAAGRRARSSARNWR